MALQRTQPNNAGNEAEYICSLRCQLVELHGRLEYEPLDETGCEDETARDAEYRRAEVACHGVMWRRRRAQLPCRRVV